MSLLARTRIVCHVPDRVDPARPGVGTTVPVLPPLELPRERPHPPRPVPPPHPPPAGGLSITATPSGATLAGVTLDGTLDLTRGNNVRARVTGGLTLNGTAMVGDGAGAYGELFFDGGQTLGGTGTVVFGASIYNALL